MCQSVIGALYPQEFPFQRMLTPYYRRKPPVKAQPLPFSALITVRAELTQDLFQRPRNVEGGSSELRWVFAEIP